MKDHSVKDVIKRNGVKQQIKCRLAQSAQSFKLLIHQYSNPIRAIIQEISANAIDSHVRAGKKETPIHVKFPGQLNSTFEIRDFGISMSKDVVERVYAEIMSSDKRDTDDEQGYWGIGSKTPLAYTDSFNVTTYLDGNMCMYTVGYDEDGWPELNFFGEFPTEEPDGVKVSFDVASVDHSRFINEAQRIFKYFDTPPTIEGATFTINEPEILFSGDNWTVIKDNSSTLFRMGQIVYALESYQVDSELRIPVLIDVPMGSVDILPSREGLEYSERTLNYIKSILPNVKKEVCDKIENKYLTDCSDWARIRKIRDLPGRIQSIIGRCNYDIPISGCYKYSKKYNGNVSRQNYSYRTFLQGSDNFIYVAWDGSSTFDRECRNLRSQTDKDIVLVNMSKKELLKNVRADEKDEVVFDVKELEKPPKRPTAPRIKKLKYISSFYRYSYSIRKCDFDISQGTHVYVDSYRKSLSTENISLLKRDLHELNESGLLPDKIFIVDSSNKGLKKKKNFITLKKWLETSVSIKDIKTKYYNLNTPRYNNWNIISYNDQDIVELQRMIKDSSSPSSAVNVLIKILKFKLEEKPIRKLEDKVLKKYPLLNHYLFAVRNGIDHASINQYLDSIKGN